MLSLDVEMAIADALAELEAGLDLADYQLVCSLGESLSEALSRASDRASTSDDDEAVQCLDALTIAFLDAESEDGDGDRTTPESQEEIHTHLERLRTLVYLAD